ncbi:MAG: SapC family protein [Thauera sp.]|nr:SapC family protein [Thauera sp.]
MSDFQPVSRSAFAARRFQRFSTYRHAADRTVVALAAQEINQACTSMPICFIEAPDGSGLTTVALLGLLAGQNLYVAPDGRWIGPYIPALLRVWPFSLARADDKQLLCVDVASGLISEGDAGERFYEDDGEPSHFTLQTLEALKQHQAGTRSLQRLVAALQAEQLITPWLLKVPVAGAERSLSGLWRIDEQRLADLPPDALARIHQAGALPLVYSQLISMQHARLLVKFAGELQRAELAQRQAASSSLMPTKDGELDLEFLNKSDTLSFG